MAARKILTHLDSMGKAKMVDVTEKEPSFRQARARGMILMKTETAALITGGTAPKGDVLAAARLAGIMAAKKTSELIPLCHPLLLTEVAISFSPDRKRGEISIEATAKTLGPTGVEMEALTAVAVAALTIYDMCKAVDREMTIGDIQLISKQGGRSDFQRDLR